MSFLVNKQTFKQIAEEFCKGYYSTFSTHGINNIINFYSPSAYITYLNDECVGQLGLSQKLYNLNISTIMFAELDGTSQESGTDIILINVSGKCSPNQTNNWMRFTDVFILQQHGGAWYIIHHIFKIIA